MQRFGPFRLDTDDECLWHETARIALPPKQFAVLRYLVEHPDRLISHDELLDAVWPEIYVQPQVLRTYVLELRKILGDDARQPRFIESLPKRGYRFVAPVSAGDGAQATRAEYPKTCKSVGQDRAIKGRDEELEALRAHFDGLAESKRRIVFITGETGIGKSALLDAFCCTVARVPEVAVARGQCVQGFAGRESYYPVMEALADLCAAPHGEHMRTILASHAPAWLELLGLPVPDGVGGLAPERAMSDLCCALEGMAAERPLLLVLDDLHWADESTVNLLATLAHRRVPTKLMVVATVGPQSREAADLKRVMSDLRVHGLCDGIRLEPLRPTQVESLLRDVLEQEGLPEHLASIVHETSEGNPLFAIAMVRHLQAERFLMRVEQEGLARWEARVPLREAEVGVPEELEQMIELEIEHLTPREQRVLEAGSLFSVAFPAWAVAVALEEDVSTTEETCDAVARRLSMVKRAGIDELPDGTHSAFYVFAHGLYRDVLYRRQTLAVRARSHVRIAEQLRTLFAGSEAMVAREIARHYEAGGQRTRAIAILQNAARLDTGRRAYGAATDTLEYALQLAEGLHVTEREPATKSLRAELMEARKAARCVEDSKCAGQEPFSKIC